MGTRYVITGAGGQLGRSLVELLAPVGGRKDRLAAGYGRADLDIGDSASLGRVFETSPDVVVNAAAFTAVDRCESEPEIARRINTIAPGELAARCAKEGARFVHVSTDYVFDGESETPYREDAATGPRSAYGRTKLEGEQRVLAANPESLVVRTSWVFGPGKNFVEAILRQAALRRSGDAAGPLRVVADQSGAPTSAQDLAGGILDLVAAGVRGLVHLSNGGTTTWHGFAREILDQSGARDLEIDAITTAELDLPAPRPRFSRLDCSRARALGVVLRPWQEALAAYLETRTR